MKCTKAMMKLYAVTDRAWTGKMTLAEQVEAALQNGVTCVQLREKCLEDGEFLQEASKIGALCRKYKVPFLINDRADIALAVHADGVHLGQEDADPAKIRRLAGEDFIIGVSAHTMEEALKAQADGADYLGLGAAFPTETKPDVDCMPRTVMEEICKGVSIPTVAIGGIHPANISKLAGTGVDGIAVVSAIFGAKDPGKASKELLELTEWMLEER